MSHTPGPWYWSTSNSFRRLSSANGDGDVLCAVVQRDGHPDVHFKNGGYEGPDAILIASAPALLDACKKLLGLAKRSGWIHIDINNAQRVIEEAEGK